MSIFNIVENEIKKNIAQNKQLIVIGVDGPTASGKTFFAQGLKNYLKKKKYNSWIFELDWTLKNRIYREKYLKNIFKQNLFFEFEAEEHMNLDIASNFLFKIEQHNKKKFNSNSFFKTKLNKLYDRNNDGRCSRVIDVKLSSQTIILIEGHYTLRNDLDKFIDFNILLLSSQKELLKRKINRVGKYRNKEKTKKYFFLLDIPSFINHLERNLFKTDLIIENTNYKKPIIKKTNYGEKWIKKNNNYFISKNLKNSQLLEKELKILFPERFINKFNLTSNLNKIIYQLLLFDKKVNFFLKKTIKELTYDLQDTLIFVIKKINQIVSKNLKIELSYIDQFSDIFKRQMPIHFGFKIKFENIDTNVFFLAEIDKNNLSIIVSYKGTNKKIIFKRNLGEDINVKKYETKISRLSPKISDYNNLFVYIPTQFMFPHFLSNENVTTIFTGLEDNKIAAGKIFNLFQKRNIFWIHRFATFSYRNFFYEITTNLGLLSFCIGNYLIVIKNNSRYVRKKSIIYFSKFIVDKKLVENQKNSEEKYDRIINQERNILKKTVKNKSNSFKIMDGNFFLKDSNLFLTNTLNILNEIEKFLFSGHRLVRKKITEFINANFPNLFLDTNLLWDDISSENSKKINLNSFTNISPSILSDIYLWLSIYKRKSAILGSNIYDVRKSSLDAFSYLNVAQNRATPINLQTSLNSAGQKEKFKNKNIIGYLKLKNGPIDYIDSVMKSARDVYLKNEKNFIFGIGLDHIDLRYDTPKGRAKRFLQKAQNTELLTHIVLDGSYYFDLFKGNDKTRIFKKIVNYETELITKNPRNYIYDYEFCASELNYLDKDKAFIPTVNDLNFFATEIYKELIKKNLSEINVRPKLIIGNLGTTHHSEDKFNISLNNSEEWRENLKKFYFVSPVLHGTSRSHPKVLKNATIGCHKINVAGDLLQTFLKSLPTELYKKVISKNDEEKKKLFLIRNKLNKLSENSKNKIINNLKSHCETIMLNINSPLLTNMDINYFKYKFFKYSKRQVKTILDALKLEIKSKKKLFNKRLNNKSLFLPSLIEIPYGSKYKETVKTLYKNNCNKFHVDVGDGNFIFRKIDAINKVKFLKSVNDKIDVHLHLMVENPHKGGKLSYIEQYIKLGCKKIGIHRRSFKNFNEFSQSIDLIKSYNCIPGIFIDVYEEINEELLNLIKEKKINWIILMGVPVGFGGQPFDTNVFGKLVALRNFSSSHNLNIKLEIDGGLSFENIKLCKTLGANYLSGWSIINSQTLDALNKRIKKLQNILNS